MVNIKALIEQRSAVLDEMNKMVDALETKKEDNTIETRAFTDEEQKHFGELKAKADSLTATIASLEEKRSIENVQPAGQTETAEEIEVRAFVDYLRSGKPMNVTNAETRADSNWTPAANGDTIPISIANKIIEKIKEISPIYGMATMYPVGGTLNIPYYDESAGTVSMAYADEFSELESTSGQIKSISLTGFLAGALCKVSRSLLNNSQFNILDYVVNKVAQAAVDWIDDQQLNGTAGKIAGLAGGVTQIVTAAASGVITADELIDLQDTVPDAYQSGAVWIMSRKTRSAIRKLKDGEGNYLLNKDATTKWGYSLFGKPVYIADKMPDMEAGKTAIYYGDFSGLAVKTTEQINIEVLREKFATQHAVGVVAWLEMDAKVENAQKIAALKMKA